MSLLKTIREKALSNRALRSEVLDDSYFRVAPSDLRFAGITLALWQKRLLKALTDTAVDADAVDTRWVQNVWHVVDSGWVRKFCLGGEKSVLHSLKTIANAKPVARQELYHEFCRQNKVGKMLDGGGNFRDIGDLPEFTPELADAVKKFFGRCYALLSHNKKRNWNGYEFNGNRCITNHAYKDAFCSDYPTKAVCPYCDGEIGTPELDHYLAKSGFPLLACSPWNLIPVCKSCNDTVTAKGDRPAITLGPPRSTDDWLHPFFRPASAQVRIELKGTRQDAIPQLHSPDSAEQIRLSNHEGLIQSLSKRWTNVATAHLEVLIPQVKARLNAENSVKSLVNTKLEDHLASRGKEASSMVRAAVCRAFLDGRPGFFEEFDNPNAPVLD
ncbi:HNH endonuclease domain protein [delta proteobacterium NaphS2]|nr:HNH endonuclease domain protein [delta proteobacterium NaphS2]